MVIHAVGREGVRCRFFFFRYFYQSLDSVQISVFQRWMITRVCIMVAVMGVGEGGEFVNMWGSQYGHSECMQTGGRA